MPSDGVAPPAPEVTHIRPRGSNARFVGNGIARATTTGGLTARIGIRLAGDATRTRLALWATVRAGVASGLRMDVFWDVGAERSAPQPPTTSNVTPAASFKTGMRFRPHAPRTA